MPRTYDSEFRRRVIDLLRAGRSVATVAADLDLAEATVYRWKAQDLIDRGGRDVPSSSGRGELAAARRRIRELETELELVRKAAALCDRRVIVTFNQLMLTIGILVAYIANWHRGGWRKTGAGCAGWQPCRQSVNAGLLLVLYG